jgi:NTE family protein
MFRRFRRGDDVVGFALSGGGSRGASQVGALRALAEAGIRPALLAGTSAGAVNAVWYALHPQRLDALAAIWLALRRQDIFPGSRVQVLFNLARRGYVHRADRWERFLRDQVGSLCFEDAVHPCGVVAVRLRDGERVVFRSGEVVPALMASTAIPGVFPPYQIGGELYVDGGVIEPVPIPTALDMGATAVWALDCSWLGEDVSESGSTVDRSGRIAARAYVMQQTTLAATRGKLVHLLQPELPEFHDARDFSRTSELIEAGYTHARGYLQTLARGHEAG